MAQRPTAAAPRRRQTRAVPDIALVDAIDRHTQVIRELTAVIQSSVLSGDRLNLNGFESMFGGRTARPMMLPELTMDEIFLEMKAVYGKDIAWDDDVNIYPGGPGAFADTYKELNERPIFKARGLNLTNAILSICDKFGKVAQLIAHELSR